MHVIQLIGLQDRKFNRIKSLLRQVLESEDLCMDYTVEDVTDIDSVLEYDISQIPALVVNSHVIWEQNTRDLTDIRLSELLRCHLIDQPV